MAFQILEFLILLLSLASLVGFATHYLRIPYTVGLVLMGLGIGVLNRLGVFPLLHLNVDIVDFAQKQITPELILGLFVTPLIFEAAFHLNWDDLKRDLGFILALAIPGVILTSLFVGFMIYHGSKVTGAYLPFLYTTLFGAMIAATDPVSVITLFRQLGVPKRLQVIMEGESLFNDGTSIVAFGLVLSLIVGFTTIDGISTQRLLNPIADLIRIIGGGLLVGFISGWLVSQIIGFVDDPFVETTLTTILAFGAYVIAVNLNTSGVLAVVIAGLINGNIGPKGMSPITHLLVIDFWQFSAFIANSLLFLLIGLDIDIFMIFQFWQLILLAIIAVLASRAIIIYGFYRFGKKIPFQWNHALFWGGLRGAICLALALSLPFNIDAGLRSQLQGMVFGVVLFTILVQGLSMRPLVKLLHLIDYREIQEEYERRHARAATTRSAYHHLEARYHEGLISDHAWEVISPIYKERAHSLGAAAKEIMQFDAEVERQDLETARREALFAQRRSLNELLRGGMISEEVFSQLIREIDEQLLLDYSTWMQSVSETIKPKEPVTKLITAIIQAQDVENAIHALNSIGISVTRLSSFGGFLGKRNVTLLIGISGGQEINVVTLLRKTCRQRVEFVTTNFEAAPYQLPISTPITVGGATIFTLSVERFEEIK